MQLQETPPVRRTAVPRPPRGDLLLLPVGILAVSASGPLIAAAAAPALALAFWRNALAVLATGPFALARHVGELRALHRRELLLALLAGVLLAAHFATWVPSLRLTSVASATAIAAAQPVWTVLMARALGHAVPARTWTGIALALAGVVVLTGVDVSLDAASLAGDVLALLGGILASAYTVAGAEVRRTVSTTVYTTLCYATAGVVLLAACLATGEALTGYDGTTWAQLVALTVGPQLLGHSLFNRLLRTSGPTLVSLAVLLEVPGAALLAALFLGQTPPLSAVPAAVLLLAGLAVVVSGRDEDDEPVAVPVE